MRRHAAAWPTTSTAWSGDGEPVDIGWELVRIKQKRTSYGSKAAGNQRNWPGGKDDPLVARDDALDAVADGARLFSEYLAALTAEAARGFATFAARRQLDAGVLDFDDLLGRARDLLAGRTAPPAEARRVREYFQKKYRYLLVDEFQDTDPLQVEIVFLLAAEDPDDDGWATARLAPGKLFLVGDPKQSIYRFRDADIAIFQRVKELVRSQGDVLEIWQNFRTVPGVVDWVNECVPGDHRRRRRGAETGVPRHRGVARGAGSGAAQGLRPAPRESPARVEGGGGAVG